MTDVTPNTPEALTRGSWLERIIGCQNAEELVASGAIEKAEEWLRYDDSEDKEVVREEIKAIAYALLCPRFTPDGLNFVNTFRLQLLDLFRDDHVSGTLNLALHANDPNNKHPESSKNGLLRRFYNDEILRSYLSTEELNKCEELTTISPALEDEQSPPNTPSFADLRTPQYQGTLSLLQKLKKALTPPR
jgi:hypothetical protein